MIQLLLDNPRSSAITTALLIVIGGACAETPTDAHSSPTLTSIAVSPSASTIAVYETLQLFATLQDADGNELTEGTVTWSSSDPGLATVSPSGLVTGVAAGTVTITAASEGVSGAATVRVEPAPVALVEVSPSASTIIERDTVRLTATLRDVDGIELADRAVTWWSSNPNVATVSDAGLVTGMAVGSVTITATSEGVSGEATVTVEKAPVVSIEISPASSTVAVGETQQLTATLRDAGENELTGRTVIWTTSDSDIATVSGDGLVTGVAAGESTITASSEDETDTAEVIVTLPSFSIVAGNGQSGIMTDTLDTELSVRLLDSAGEPRAGVPVTFRTVTGDGLVRPAELSTGADGVATASWILGPVEGEQTLVAETAGEAPLLFNAIATGTRVWLETTEIDVAGATGCGLLPDGSMYCWNAGSWVYTPGTSPEPWKAVEVAPDFSFITIDAQGSLSCGIAVDGKTYCWGTDDSDGGVGDGTYETRKVPTEVDGSHEFHSVSVSSSGRRACAVTATAEGYCWGYNEAGYLGDGTTIRRLSPTPVYGGLVLRAISAGHYHTCGLTTEGTGFCWGSNTYGQLGDGTSERSLVPSAISGGFTFTKISAGGAYPGTYSGGSHTCAVTAEGAAYCWGRNVGQLGDGTRTDRSTPTRVVGGHDFTTVSAGADHTCALTRAGQAYCWGVNQSGELGIGTLDNTVVPVAVDTDQRFVQLDTGAGHTCATTDQGNTYCWGLFWLDYDLPLEDAPRALSPRRIIETVVP